MKIRKLIGIFSAFALVFAALNVASLLPSPAAEAAPGDAVTNVAFSDTDDTFPGVTGMDFSMTWDPSAEDPAGYIMTSLFIVPSSVDVVPGFGGATCDDDPCTPVASFFTHSTSSYIGTHSSTADSEDTAWNAGTTYKVCAVTAATTPSVACSDGGTVTSDTMASEDDSSPPIINHMGNHTAFSGQNAFINAIMRDDLTSSAAFQSLVDGGDEYFRVVYGEDMDNKETALNANTIAADYYQFSIASAFVDGLSGSTFQYYLEASDGAGNESFFCENPSATTAAHCDAAPFTVTVTAAGGRTVSGTVSQSGTGVASAKIIPGGFAIDIAVANGSGVYALAGMPNNTYVDIIGYKPGTCEMSIGAPIGTVDVANINLALLPGDCGFYGGGAEEAFVTVLSSRPPEYGMVAVDIPALLMRLTQPLDPATVNDADASDGNVDRIILTNAAGAKVGGQVFYCAQQSSPGCSSYLDSQDTNTVVFTPVENLTEAMNYEFQISSQVQSATGQPVDGNLPGGGHLIPFSTTAGAYTTEEIADNYGQSGGFMPPFVEAIQPDPYSGVDTPPDTKFIIRFNEVMDTTTLTSTYIKLLNSAGSSIASTLTVDSNDSKTVTLSPTSVLTAGEHELQVLGGVENSSGMPGISAASTSPMFSSFYQIGSTEDSTAPTIYSFLPDDSTSVEVNLGFLEYGFSEPISPQTVSASNVTLYRGANAVSASVEYDPSMNSAFLIPSNVFAPNSTYTATWTTGIEDLGGNNLVETSFSFKTGVSDTTQPTMTDARCNDNTCRVTFDEQMNHAAASNSLSVLKPQNWAISQGGNAFTGNTTITYNAPDRAVEIDNLDLTAGSTVDITLSNATDLSNLVIDGLSNSFTTMVEDSADTMGSLDSGMMFMPDFGEHGGGEFSNEGFGNFTAEEFWGGETDELFPFNNIAGQDSNVMQFRFLPTAAVEDGDQFTFTLPNGTDITNAAVDSFSPYTSDFNEWRAGTVTFDDTFDSDGISVNTNTNTVTVQLDVSGSPAPEANSFYTADFRGFRNTTVPGYSYTSTMKHIRNGESLETKTSRSFSIVEGGSNSITVNMFAGVLNDGEAGRDGDVYLFGGGPAGPMDKKVTLTDGEITAVDDVAASSIVYTNLNDGCYFVGTDSFVTLGGADFFGRSNQEPVCVTGGESATENIVLTSASAPGSVINLTVKLAGIANFSGADIEIFAGGPGAWFSKELTSVGVPNVNGYTIPLNQDGNWFIGVGPSMGKGAGANNFIPTQLPGIPPPPMDLEVSGLGGTPTISTGWGGTPPGVTFDSDNNILTFTFSAADKGVSGTVTDGTTGLANVEVFMHSQGFGTPTHSTTQADGSFTLNVSDYGVYEIGAWKDGLNPIHQMIDVQADGDDAGSDPDVYYKGKLITGANPLTLKLKKPDYSISGAVNDSNGNGIAWAPVFASDADGNFVGGMTSSDGSYTIFVDAGTWTVKSELPPDKTDACGTLSKEVTVVDENKTNQNLSPSTGTCYTLSGTVTVDGTTLANAPLFVEAWDNANDQPAAGGMFRPAGTDSDGAYSVNVAGGSIYRIGTWSPDYGEISAVTPDTVSANTTLDITKSIATVTFAFTGGTADMNAFIELKDDNDQFNRLGKQKNGLDSSMTMSVPTGTYKYFVDIFGVGDYSGTVIAGNTVTIDLSTTSVYTVSGTIKDGDGTALKGALVTLKDTTTGMVKTATTNSSGAYSAVVKEGTYTTSANLSGYVPGETPASLEVTADTADYDFGGDSPDQTALAASGNVISGTIYQSDGSTPVTDGFVTATNANGLVSTVAIDPQDGSYSVPVDDGTWTLEGVAPLHGKTEGSSSVAISSADGSQNITLASDPTKTSLSSSAVLAANTGGSVNDIDNTGIKITAGSGALVAGESDVTITTERSFTAPDTASYTPLGDAAFGISASTSTTVKDLAGNVDITFDYTDLLSDLATMPEGTTEDDLELVYFSTESGEYVPVEGGFAIDTNNNTVTGSTNHFTDFALVVASSGSAPDTPTGLAATALGDTQATLTWTTVSGATSYDLYRSTTTDGTFGRIGSEPTVGAVTTYTDSGLTAGQTYYYKVSALNGSGESASTAAPVSVSMPGGALVVSPGGGGGGGGGSSSKKTTDDDDEDDTDEDADTTDAEAGGGAADDTAVEESAPAGGGSGSSGGAAAEPVVTNSTPFEDVTYHWSKTYVEDMYDKEVVSGTTSETFSPDDYITKAEIAKIAVTAFELKLPNVVKTAPFRDVPKTDMFAKYIQAAYDADVMEGFSDGSFGPENYVTRADTLMVLLGSAGADVDDTDYEASFPDVKSAAWYAPYVNFATEKGVISGYADGKFKPYNYVSRGEISKMASLILKKVVVDEVVGLIYGAL
jgi:hypothetical protein